MTISNLYCDNSTIKRSGWIIVLGADGKVAEQGTYANLSARDGPFNRLMEYQLHGEPRALYTGPPSADDVYEETQQHGHQEDEEVEPEEEEETEVGKTRTERVVEAEIRR